MPVVFDMSDPGESTVGVLVVSQLALDERPDGNVLFRLKAEKPCSSPEQNMFFF